MFVHIQWISKTFSICCYIFHKVLPCPFSCLFQVMGYTVERVGLKLSAVASSVNYSFYKTFLQRYASSWILELQSLILPSSCVMYWMTRIYTKVFTFALILLSLFSIGVLLPKLAVSVFSSSSALSTISHNFDFVCIDNDHTLCFQKHFNCSREYKNELSFPSCFISNIVLCEVWSSLFMYESPQRTL